MISLGFMAANYIRNFIQLYPFLSDYKKIYPIKKPQSEVIHHDNSYLLSILITLSCYKLSKRNYLK